MKSRILSILLLLAITLPVSAAEIVGNITTEFGTFDGVLYLRHSGRFVGSTSLGEFRMPYEVIAPAEPSLGNRTVLVEPPHFSFGPVAREFVLGREFLFGRGYSYVSVGFGLNGLNVLDPTATDLVLAGAPVPPGGGIDPGAVVDEEILVQFTQALRTDPFLVALLGRVNRIYAYGVSQTSGVLLETLHGPFGQGLFDLTVLHIALWRPPFRPPGVFDHINGEYAPVAGVGGVMFVESEADQVVSDSEQFRRAVGEHTYRVYESAGAAHQPSGLNPLDHFAVVRALFVAGDLWVRRGIDPPPSTLIEESTTGDPDPVYGFFTAIARDEDLNAIGGVRLPDLELGRAQYIASDFSLGLPPGLLGNSVDLSCEPRPGSSSDRPRFRNHGQYVAGVVHQALALWRARFLLAEDAVALVKQAAASDVGKPGTCSP
jgi:Alpha/beta hydrolase domain